jgi:hypothetical protein
MRFCSDCRKNMTSPYGWVIGRWVFDYLREASPLNLHPKGRSSFLVEFNLIHQAKKIFLSTILFGPCHRLQITCKIPEVLVNLEGLGENIHALTSKGGGLPQGNMEPSSERPVQQGFQLYLGRGYNGSTYYCYSSSVRHLKIFFTF